MSRVETKIMKLNVQSIKFGAVLIALGLLTACGGRLTQENFDKVSVGMPAKEVKNLLGEPTQTDTVTIPVVGSVTRYNYKTDKGEVSVLFRDDVVQSKMGSMGK